MNIQAWQVPTIDEEGLAQQAPVVRAEILRRLELLWTALAPHISGLPDPDGIVYRPDPRLVDAGLRVLRHLSVLYRLEAPRPSTPPIQATTTEDLVQVTAQLEVLEARMSGLAAS